MTTSEGISRRFREELARHDITSESEAARRAGVTQPWLSRRLTGATDWTITELESTCTALGLSFAYVATGDRDPTQRRPFSADEVMSAIADYVTTRLHIPAVPIDAAGEHERGDPKATKTRTRKRAEPSIRNVAAKRSI